MKAPSRKLLYGLLTLLYLLHNDLWFWEDGRLVMGFPVGLFYHIAYCVAASFLMLALVRYAWPDHLDDREDGEFS